MPETQPVAYFFTRYISIQVPDYYDIIKKPIALNTIREKVNNCEYQTAGEPRVDHCGQNMRASVHNVNMWLSFLSIWCLQASISQMWSWCSPTVFSIILVTLMRRRPDIDCSGSSTLSWADLAYWSTALPCPPNAPDTEADALLSPSPPSRDWKEETDVEVAVVLFPKDWKGVKIY